MSGWIEFTQQIISCPFCSEIFTALFCEDVSLYRNVQIINGLSGGKTTCPNCKRIITDRDLSGDDKQHAEPTSESIS